MTRPTDFAGPPRRAQRGLTLMELLVVLLLVALLGTLVVQGLAFFLGNYDAVTRVRREATVDALRQHWFATAVRGIVPYGVESRAFAGESSSFVAMTLQPLNTEPGLPTETRWSISDVGGSQVVTYDENGTLAWPMLEVDDADLGFQYADDANRWHARWPIEDSVRRRLYNADEPIQWTPTMIRLASSDGTVWLAAVDANPVVPVTDALLR